MIESGSGPPLRSRNGLWDRVLADALADAGIRDAMVCPGGRNSLLSLTLAATAELTSRPHIDERGASFAALGLTAATGRAVAVCTTSGSAVANCLPALAEASPRGLPVVLVSCDRPLGTRRPREPQVIAQGAVCRPLVSRQLLLGDPSTAEEDLERLRREVMTAVVTARGPVHINVPQWGMACSSEPDSGWHAPVGAGAIRARVPAPPSARIPGATAADVVTAAVAIGARPGTRGLIVVGGGPSLPTEQVIDLAAATQFPVLADPASGLRRSGVPGLVTTADALTFAPRVALHRTELLIRLGDAPASTLLQDALAALRCPVLRFAGHDPGPDFVSPDCIALLPPAPDALAALSRCLAPGDGDWARTWAEAERHAAANRTRFLGRLPWGEVRAAGLACNAPGFPVLHLANSLAVRHASLMLGPGAAPRRVFVNRGMNGTDGTLATFLGELLGTGQPGLALVGDQAAAHDVSALTAAAWDEVAGAICVIDNGGGGIFDLVACSEVPGYGATMRNPPRIAFEQVAQAFSFGYERCTDAAALARALERAGRRDRITLLHVIVGQTAARDLPRLVRAMSARAPALHPYRLTASPPPPGLSAGTCGHS